MVALFRILNFLSCVLCHGIFAQIVCGEQNRLETTKNTQTTLRLTDINVQEASFEWTVKMEKENACQSQRCTLLNWQASRNLQKYLAYYNLNSSAPELVIDNALLEQGKKYSIDLKIREGAKITHKHFDIPDNNIDVTPVSSQPTGSLELQGPRTTYADIEVFINADVILCNGDVENVKMIWELLDDTGQALRLAQEGQELTLPSMSLTANKQYTVKSSAIFNETIIDTKTHKFNVIKMGLILKLNAKYLTVGTNESIRILAYIQDPDNTGIDIDIEWTCIFRENDCEDFSQANALLELQNGFQESGEYNVTITITNGIENKIESCIINVIDGVRRNIELYEIKNLYDINENIEITARISGLSTGCHIQWININIDKYESVQLSEMPGYLGIINTTVKEDSFLDELGDFENTTMNKDFSLLIPPSTGNWKGLTGDVKYIFRLSVNCTETGGNTSTISSDVEINTNNPPTINPLNVNPTEGLALFTKFKFRTEMAQEKVSDYPLFYKFGFKLGNATLFFKTLNDFFETESMLPYAEGGIQTILKVCDSKNACSTINGPIVTTQIPNDITVEDDMRLKQKLTNLLRNNEYNKAIIYSMSILETYKYLNNDLLEDDMRTFILNELNLELSTLINNSTITSELRTASNELIKQITVLATSAKLSEEIIDNIIKLRAKFESRQRARIVTDQETLLQILNYLGTIRSKDISTFSVQNVVEYFDWSEFIIKNSGTSTTIEEHKLDLILSFDKFMGKLCSLLYKGQPIKISLKTLTFSLEKLQINYFKLYTTIPELPNRWMKYMKIKFGEWKKEIEDQKLCVAKGLLDGYFAEGEINYFANVYNANTFMKIDDGLVGDKNIMLEKTSSNPQQCLVYKNNQWTPCILVKSSSTQVLCKCPNLGFYRVADANENEISTLGTTTTTEATISAAGDSVNVTHSQADGADIENPSNNDESIVTTPPSNPGNNNSSPGSSNANSESNPLNPEIAGSDISGSSGNQSNSDEGNQITATSNNSQKPSSNNNVNTSNDVDNNKNQIGNEVTGADDSQNNNNGNNGENQVPNAHPNNVGSGSSTNAHGNDMNGYGQTGGNSQDALNNNNQGNNMNGNGQTAGNPENPVDSSINNNEEGNWNGNGQTINPGSSQNASIDSNQGTKMNGNGQTAGNPENPVDSINNNDGGNLNGNGQTVNSGSSQNASIDSNQGNNMNGNVPTAGNPGSSQDGSNDNNQGNNMNGNAHTAGNPLDTSNNNQGNKINENRETAGNSTDIANSSDQGNNMDGNGQAMGSGANSEYNSTNSNEGNPGSTVEASTNNNQGNTNTNNVNGNPQDPSTSNNPGNNFNGNGETVGNSGSSLDINQESNMNGNAQTAGNPLDASNNNQGNNMNGNGETAQDTTSINHQDNNVNGNEQTGNPQDASTNNIEGNAGNPQDASINSNQGNNINGNEQPPGNPGSTVDAFTNNITQGNMNGNGQSSGSPEGSSTNNTPGNLGSSQNPPSNNMNGNEQAERNDKNSTNELQNSSNNNQDQSNGNIGNPGSNLTANNNTNAQPIEGNNTDSKEGSNQSGNANSSASDTASNNGISVQNRSEGNLNINGSLNGSFLNDVEITQNRTAIRSASILGGGNLTKGDEISLIIIGLSILGMVTIGIIGAVCNRIKRERTIETTDSLEFPKYANIFNQEAIDTIS